MLLRKPLEVAALAGLLDLSVDSVLNAVSTTPVSIVRKNREKLDSRFIAPGITVLKEGNDC